MKKKTATQLLENVRTTYDEIAVEFDRTRQRVWPDFDKFTPFLSKNARVLDVGCGNGRLLRYLGDKSYKAYLGVDNSIGLLKCAREQHTQENVRFKQGSIMDIPVKSGGYDAVFSIAVLHHIPSREFQLKALSELRRVMKPDGRLFLTVWDLYRLKSLPYFSRSVVRSASTLGDYSYKDLFVPWGRKNPKPRFAHAFTMRELRKLLMLAGFEVMGSWTLGTGKSGNHVIVARPFLEARRTPETNLVGVDFDAVTLDESVDLVAGFIRSHAQHRVVTPNPEILLKARSDESYLSILNKASLSIPDGVGVLWAASYVKGRRGFRRFLSGLWGLFMVALLPSRVRRVFPERVTGTDLVHEILDQSHVIGAKVFLLGAFEGVAEEVAQKYRYAQIVGTYAGSPKSSHEKKIVKMIEESGANVLLVAYGAPHQEKWIDRNVAKLPQVRVAIGVGGAFDFLAGVRLRAPQLMQKTGLEWFWRLVQQPKRIGRILNATIRFPWVMLMGRD